ncbi:uncharacterized protein A1O5_12122 [Cladophialophora psammophila CBS 110553]|uniref:Uncharacterized protein n=1 Tax=Cladophialophora psammophila CBS 110553 TaxID=1182543 RepID=W9VUU5_9EURO|nr:uncharacterized protein A1O5_12122 [Cladophialophora psammophila CBS 110553]EXJ59497.1 hypothetical protein A1O5_12122 [Cladophialophora psammophila CBS 110553]
MTFPNHNDAFSLAEAYIKSEDYGYGAHESDPEYREDNSHDVLKKCLHHLGLAKNYAPQWLPRDAFREFYQNWKDGIVESFGVDPQSIKPVFLRNDDQEIHIAVSVRTPSGVVTDNDQLLGYIRFQSKPGCLELTNFKAKLERKHLDLGETTKRNNNALAGGHGEGFKLAALVMRRNGHSVRFETNSFCWNFSFRGARPRLCCLLGKPPPKLMQEQRAEYTRQRAAGHSQRGLTSYIWEDMTVKIGKSRDREGAQKVTEQDFREWMKVSIDLDPPAENKIVRTWLGDLILDPRFRGRIYLHGLLVAEFTGHAPGGKDYRFGYNFHRGSINRDRQRMADDHEEAETLASIWGLAMLKEGDPVVDSYIQLFAEDEESPDIAQADKYASRLTAQSICRRLKVSHPQTFFYSERGASEQNATTDEDIISKELKKQPFKLRKKLWQIIRQDPPLMRTPLEERNRLFERSQRVEPCQDIFAINICRSLKGSFALDPRLSNVRIEFVDGADTAIDLLYTVGQNLLQIHEKWLHVSRVHQPSSCEFFKVAGEQMTCDRAFFCDHVVQDLLEVAFEEVRVPLGLAPENAACLRRNAVEYLRKMPRAIEVRALGAEKKLEVRWTANESGAFVERYGANIHYWVTLHKESSCGWKRTEVLNDIDTNQGSVKLGQASNHCDCPTRTVSRAQSQVIFDGLSTDELYFPMVSRAENPSFFGLAPVAVLSASPADQVLDADQESSPNSETVENDSDSNEDFRVRVPATNVPARTKIVSDRTKLRKDEEAWLEWHQGHHPSTLSRFFSTPPQALQANGVTIPALHSEDLNHTFERDCYFWIDLGGGEGGSQIIFVHKIFQTHNQSGESYSLLVTRYFALNSIFPPERLQTTGKPAANNRELILHFCDFDKMRTSQDAEIILLDDIIAFARRVGTIPGNSISHVFKHIPETDSEEYFCRFGFCNTVAEGGVTSITPLASHLLLHHKDLWQRPSFHSNATPLAFELTPSVLGVSEGFSKEGFKIQAAFGLDEMKHNTWMIRHNVAQSFDGAILNILKDFDSEKLVPIQLPGRASPKVLLFASEHSCFRLDPQNRQMPTLRQFLKPLDAIDEAVVSLKPDFVVMLLPPAVRHPSAIARFSKTLLGLLQMRFSVHLTLLRLKNYGLPQERSILAIVASPFCAPLPWKFDRYADEPATIGGLIVDLAFKNPRMENKSNTGFVCLHPNAGGPRGEMSRLDHVYNHYTGIRVGPGAESISMDGDTIFTFFNDRKEWAHPGKFSFRPEFPPTI